MPMELDVLEEGGVEVLFGFGEFDNVEMQLNEIDNIAIRIPRQFKRTSYFETYSEKQFFERFRLSKNSAHEVLLQIEEELQFVSGRY